MQAVGALTFSTVTVQYADAIHHVHHLTRLDGGVHHRRVWGAGGSLLHRGERLTAQGTRAYIGTPLPQDLTAQAMPGGC